MPSQLDVINYALTEIGRLPVTNAADQPSSQLMEAKLPALLGKFLQLTDWNYSIKFVVNNTPQVSPFSADFLYSYQLPPDFLRFDRMSPLTTNFGLYYRIIDSLLCTNMKPIQYYYVSATLDYSILPPTSFIALSLYLAAETVMALTNNISLTAYIKKRFDDAMADAMRFNDMERMVQSLPYNDFDRQTYI
jgi:hypothetical protein